MGPYLTEIATGSRWAEDENDKFPSDQQCSDVFEQMMSWFSGKFPAKCHGRVVTRLRSTRRTRDETFAEIIAAYFIENACGYPVVDWEPEFAQGKTADFTMVVPLRTSSPEILVEVKAPSWTRERVEATRERIENLEVQRLSVIGQESASQLNARLTKEKDSLKRVNSERKYGDDLKAKSFDFRDDLGRALVKTCFADDAKIARLPSDRPTLLIIVDDLELGMQEPGGEFTVKRGLYHQPSVPVYPRGLFLDTRFNRLGGLATMEKAWLYERRNPERFFTLFPNFWALPACRLPNIALSKFLADLSQWLAGCEEAGYSLSGRVKTARSAVLEKGVYRLMSEMEKEVCGIEQQCSYCGERLKEIFQFYGRDVPRDLNEMQADSKAPDPEAMVRHRDQRHEEKIIKAFALKFGLQYVGGC